MDCLFPNKSPGRARRMGCHCQRCRDHAAAWRRKWREDPNNLLRDRTASKKYDKKTHRKARANARKSFRRTACKNDIKLLSKEELDRIYRIYAESQFLTEVTGIKHHVDHIIPLSKGGMHHPDNLQILTATENLKKGARILDIGNVKPIVE